MSAPALLLAVPILAGVIAGALSSVDAQSGLVPLGAAWLAAALALYRGRSGLVVAATVVGCTAAGMSLGARARVETTQPALLAWVSRSPAADAPVRLTGVLREDAGITSGGLGAVLDVTEAGGLSLRGGVRITVGGAHAGSIRHDWRAGRTVSLTAVLREPLDYRDPGVPSDRRRLARQGIVLLASVKSAALASVDRRGPPLSEAAGALRSWVRAAIAAAIGAGRPRSVGVVTAILIGDRSGLSIEDERRLQEAGTYHVIAISGGNIALLTALLVAAGRAARLPARGTAAAAIAVLAFYGYAAGLAPSVLRATLAGVVYLAARALDHRGTAVNALAIAATCAAVIAPLTILDAGFVLSFGATLGIVTMASRFVPIMRREREAGRLRTWRRRLLYAAAALCAATVSAEIALAPVGARLFGRISVAGLLLNFAAIPLMSIIQIAGLAALALFVFSPAAAGACGWIAHAGTTALLGSAALVDRAPWLVLDVPPPGVGIMVAWYVGWALLLLSRRAAVRGAAAIGILVSGALIVRAPAATVAVAVPRPADGWTRVVFLDVGQGDATLVWPAGASPIVVDAGGAPGTSFDVGRRVTLPASWAFGVRRLGALVLTHGDPDHIGGAPALVRALRPAAVWDGIPVPRHEPLQRLRATASAYGVQWLERRAGETVIAGAARISVLNPTAPDWERQKVRNDDSVVLDVRVGDVSFLLTGDITRAVERDVMARFEPSPVTIVKAPHHGSAGSSSQGFVDALRPAAVIFSAGRRNPFGHPAPAAVARYRAAGTRIFNTADEGAVVFETDGRRVVAWTWMGKREVIRGANGVTAHHKEH